jgi:hypothetical protein
MKLEEAARYGTAGAVSRAAANLARKPAKTEAHAHHAKLESLREADHRGHHITIKTKYAILVDGKPVVTPLHVTTDGQVRCHALPNYSFSSAVDLVKQLIDAYPADFTGNGGGGDHPGHDHGGQGRHHGHVTRKRPRRTGVRTKRGPHGHAHHR